MASEEKIENETKKQETQPAPEVEALEPSDQPIPPGRKVSQPKRGRGLTTVLLIVLFLSNLSLTAYVFYSSNSQNMDLRNQVSGVTSSVSGISSQLTTLSTKLSQLNVTHSNVTSITAGNFTAAQIYDSTKDSVVLIKVSLITGTAQGSGFVYDTEGRIITNNHVVDGTLNNGITVTFLNGTIVDATVVGTDPYNDIAVIKVNAPTTLLKPLKLGNSSALKVGEEVLAIGNPYGLADTLTKGIVSALGRQMDSDYGYPIVDVIQTDAPINPGNSGGPLLNMRGEVVGINTAIASETSNGIGFAVSSDTISRELPSLITSGHYNQAYLGISGIEVTPSIIAAMNLPEGTYGTLVTNVSSGGPADKAGLKGGTKVTMIDSTPTAIGGDVIIGADGNKLKTFYDLLVYIQRNKKPGDTVTLNVIRNNIGMNITVTLGTRPLSG